MKIKHISVFLLLVLFASVFVACSNQVVDYPNVEEFEAALNNGENLTGKTVTFTVKKFVPNSVFGYNMQAGDHLNFCSSDNPNVTEGDIVTVEVTEISSVLGTYIIKYQLID